MTRLPVLCLLLLAVLVLSIGCGGSGENPTKEKSEQYDIHDIENPIPSSALDVKIEASKTIIKPGEVIEIIHTVVTGVSRMISTDGLDTRTKILTETKTILLTVAGE